jgi:hypothetical protein
MLQRSIGNRAVTQLLGRQHSDMPMQQQSRPTLQRAPLSASDSKIQRWSFKNWFKRSSEKSSEQGPESSTEKPKEDTELAPNNSNLQNSEKSAPQVKGQGKVAPDRYELTMGVEREDENFLTNSVKFTVGKFTRKFGVESGPEEPPRRAGHAWVALKTYKENRQLSNRSYGLGPEGIMHPDPYASRPTGPATLFKDHEISADTYARVVDRLRTVRRQLRQGKMRYESFGYNCAAFVRDITQAAGLSFPGRKVIPFVFHGKPSAFTPNRLYQALEKQYNKGVEGVYHDPAKKHTNKNSGKESGLKRLLKRLKFQGRAPQKESSKPTSQRVEPQGVEPQNNQEAPKPEEVQEDVQQEGSEPEADESFPPEYENVKRYTIPEGKTLFVCNQDNLPLGLATGGTTIGITGVVSGGRVEIIWRGKPHYISERLWKMTLGFDYSELAKGDESNDELVNS